MAIWLASCLSPPKPCKSQPTMATHQTLPLTVSLPHQPHQRLTSSSESNMPICTRRGEGGWGRERGERALRTDRRGGARDIDHTTPTTHCPPTHPPPTWTTLLRCVNCALKRPVGICIILPSRQAGKQAHTSRYGAPQGSAAPVPSPPRPRHVLVLMCPPTHPPTHPPALSARPPTHPVHALEGQGAHAEGLGTFAPRLQRQRAGQAGR